MSSLREKEKSKEQQEKLQAILSQLLKDEDNKYCVDCDAKGPRWASWNLGIFLCIRCAGIHRNLGVHISKVKSVNLDSWTPEQVGMMQEIGNSRGRAVYEANIPDGFRRPQSDSALEAFIRAKYEHKKYIAREWVPPQPKPPKDWSNDVKEKKKPRARGGASIQIPSVPKPTTKPTENVAEPTKEEVKVPQPSAPSAASNDLLGLDMGSSQSNIQQPPTSSSSTGNELLDIFGGSPQQTSSNAPPTSASSDLMNGASNGNIFGEEKAAPAEEKKSTKDSIMALFGGNSQQPQMYGVPGGMYVPQGQQMYGQMMGQPQQGMMPHQNMIGQPQGMMPQAGMMPQQQAMMGQQQGMMPQQQMMMGNPQMNGAQQPGMYGGQIMPNNQGMYTPQQMQQMQFQQMQQQMTNMKLGGTQMGTVPQQTPTWGNQPTGQTLSTNLWQ